MTTRDFAIPQTLRVKQTAFNDEVHPPEMLALRGQTVRNMQPHSRVLVVLDSNGEWWGLYPDEVETIDAEYTI